MKIVMLLLAVLSGLPSFCQYFKTEFYDRKLIKIRDDIYVFNMPDPYRYFVEGNVMVIINDADVIVIESTGSRTGARKLIASIKELTKKPVRYLINTHFHIDHVLGNEEFRKAFPGIDIISTGYTKSQLRSEDSAYLSGFTIDSNFKKKLAVIDNSIKRVKDEAYPGHEKLLAFMDFYKNHDIYARRKEYEAAELTEPTITFEHELTIYRGNRQIKLLYLGKGDTPGDAWIYLPKEKILVSGDALVHPTPYGFSQSPEEWISTLKRAAGMDFDVLLPGHGDVLYNKDYLNLVIRSLEAIKDQTAKAIEKGLSLEEAKSSIDIAAIEKEYTGGDAIRRHFFNLWFKNPAITEMYNYLKGANKK